MHPCPPPTIVVDSTVFGDPPNPQGRLLKQLGEYARQTSSRIYVPTVVDKECRTRIAGAAEEAHRKLSIDVKRLRKLGLDGIPVPDLDEMRESALQLWDSRLSELGVQVVPTPATPHDDIVDKLHAGASPFIHGGDRREDGYRDYLVWRSAIDAARASDDGSAVFVSSDRAFGGKRKRTDLAEELQAEAADSGVTLHWRQDLYQFLETEAQPCLGVREEATSLAAEYVSSAMFREFMSDVDLGDSSPADVGFAPEDYDLRYLDDLVIEEVVDVGPAVLDGLLSLNDDEWTGRVRIDYVDIRLSHFFSPEDWWGFDDDSWITVDITGFSKRHARASLTVRLENVLLEVEFAALDGAVEALSVSLESVMDVYPPE